jgi:hypothetical protein
MLGGSLAMPLAAIAARARRHTRQSEPEAVFDHFRKSLEDLINRATPPEEKRAIVSRMRDTLVQAKVGVQEMEEALARSRQRLDKERRELDTVRRRKGLAAQIGDTETVAVAEKYEQLHAERMDVLESKLAAQERELELAQRDVQEMSKELRLAASGAMPAMGSTEREAMEEVDAALGGAPGQGPASSAVRDEIDSLGRARSRADRDADAQRKLDELKRRMGK